MYQEVNKICTNKLKSIQNAFINTCIHKEKNLRSRKKEVVPTSNITEKFNEFLLLIHE